MYLHIYIHMYMHIYKSYMYTHVYTSDAQKLQVKEHFKIVAVLLLVGVQKDHVEAVAWQHAGQVG